jgi:cobalt-zinc-cadmium efflux system outer membrane protein
VLRSTTTVMMVLIAAGITGVPSGAHAQEQVRRVTLEEALRLFGENNLELRLSRANVREAAGLTRQAGAVANPLLNVTYESLSGGGTTYSETYINAIQRIDWLWQRGARRGAAEETLLAAHAGLRSDSLRLVFEVKRAFVEAAAMEQLLEIIQQVHAVFRLADERGAVRFAEGDISGYDLRRLRFERARYENLVAEAEIALTLARRELTTLTLPEAVNVSVAPDGTDARGPRVIGSGSVLDRALDARPEIAAAQARVGSAQADARLNRALRVSEASVVGGFKRQSDGFNGVFLGLNMPIPILDRRGGAVEAADARLLAADQRLALVRRLVETDVRRAHDRYASIVRRVGLLQGDVIEGATDLLEIAQISYAEGEMSLIELLDAADAFREARTTLTELRMAHWVSFYDLERAMGGFPALEGEQ